MKQVYAGGMPTPEQLLNAIASPSFAQNARRKWTSKYDQLALATGTLDYIYFDTNVGNQFVRNARFPISGNEVFFITDFDLYLDAPAITTTFADLDEIFGRSFLEITVNQRQQIKVPLLEVLCFYYNDLVGNALPTVLRERQHKARKRLLYPIIMNSTAAVQFKLTLSTAAATALNGKNARLGLYGIQFDKLDTFHYDVWKNSNYQRLDYTMYQTNLVDVATEKTFSLFQPSGQAETDYSKLLPFSEIERFDVNAIEVGFFPSAVTANAQTVFEDRRDNVLKIRVEDVEYFNAQIKDMLSFSNSFATSFDDSAGGVTTNLLGREIQRQNLTLQVPITFPSKSNVAITLLQPAASLEVDDYSTVLLKGVLTRRVV